MQIKTKKRSKKPAIIIFIVIAILVLYGLMAYAYRLPPFQGNELIDGTSKVDNVNYKKPNREQRTAGNDIKANESKDESTDVQNNSAASPPPALDPKEPVEIVFTSKQIQPSGNLELRTLIQALNKGGTCQLIIMRNESIVYTASSQVQSYSNTAACDGFTIPANKLGGSGTVYVKVVYSNGDASGSDTSEVRIP